MKLFNSFEDPRTSPRIETSARPFINAAAELASQWPHQASTKVATYRHVVSLDYLTIGNSH